MKPTIRMTRPQEALLGAGQNPIQRSLSRQSPGAGLWLPAALAWVLSGCGGGVDSGGTGQPMVSSMAQGPITGFGSVVVAGVHYNEATASIHDGDGQVLSADALKLGMVATVEAGAVNTTGAVPTAQASSIRVGEQVLGPIAALDATACTVTVLGQKVAAVAATILDASVPLSSSSCRLAALNTGQLLAVHGQWDPALGRLVASRIALRAQASTYVLLAQVNAYDAAARTLTLSGLPISLAALGSAGLPATLPAGGFARVKLATSQVAGQWSAVSLQDATLALRAEVQLELEGRVTQFTSPLSFSVNGVPVDARGASFPSGPSGLALGAKVEVEGTSLGGTLTARTVKVDATPDDEAEAVEIEGSITALDRSAKTFVVRAVLVSYAANPVLEGGTLADLAVGGKVSVKGKPSADGSRLVATSIHIER